MKLFNISKCINILFNNSYMYPIFNFSTTKSPKKDKKDEKDENNGLIWIWVTIALIVAAGAYFGLYYGCKKAFNSFKKIMKQESQDEIETSHHATEIIPLHPSKNTRIRHHKNFV